MSDIEALRSIPLFGGLSDEQLQAVSRAARRRKVAGGAVILEEGGRDDSLYILASGSVEVAKRLGLAAESQLAVAKKTLIRLDAPQFFGEIGLLDDIERSATISAHGDCEVLELSRSEWERLVEEDLALGYQVLHNIVIVLGQRLRRTDRDVIKLTAALSLALGNR